MARRSSSRYPPGVDVVWATGGDSGAGVATGAAAATAVTVGAEVSSADGIISKAWPPGLPYTEILNPRKTLVGRAGFAR